MVFELVGEKPNSNAQEFVNTAQKKLYKYKLFGQKQQHHNTSTSKPYCYRSSCYYYKEKLQSWQFSSRKTNIELHIGKFLCMAKKTKGSRSSFQLRRGGGGGTTKTSKRGMKVHKSNSSLSRKSLGKYPLKMSNSNTWLPLKIAMSESMMHATKNGRRSSLIGHR